MANADPNWPRWIRASAQNHLKQVALDNSSIIEASIVEGFEPREDVFKDASLRAEIRWVGPFTIKWNPNYWVGRCFANVLLAQKLGEVDNRYLLDTASGFFYSAMDRQIEVTKRGDGVDDDDSFVGCLSPVTERATPVRVIDLGVIDTTDKQRQCLVTATYFIELQT